MNIRILKLLLLFFIVSPLAHATPIWEKPSQPPRTSDLRDLVAHPLQPGELIVASRHEIMQSSGAKDWQALWKIANAQNEIREIHGATSDPDLFFALTTRGLFHRPLSNNQWRQVFQGRNDQERQVLSFTTLPEDAAHWFVGTQAGLFESDNQGDTWFRLGHFRSDTILLLHFSNQGLYVATGKDLYLSSDLNFFQKIFSSSEDLFHDIVSHENWLWLATQKGVFESSDYGKTWQKLSQSGMQKSSVEHLIYAPETRELFAGTRQGVYRFQSQKKQWSWFSSGLENQSVLGMTLVSDASQKLMVITYSGLHEFRIDPNEIVLDFPTTIPANQLLLFRDLIEQEPSSRALQEQVIQYANLSNKKIKRWHFASRAASLMPNVSFGHDLSRANNVNIDRGTSSTPDQFIFGPDDESEGWDLGLSWDLGDFIWSSSQTSIDSRDKIMVDFRNDVLAEATRIYYERRRLQSEMLFTPPTSEREHFERLVRIDELTSLLDSLTGGWYSEALQDLYTRHPTYDELWTYASQKAI